MNRRDSFFWLSSIEKTKQIVKLYSIFLRQKKLIQEKAKGRNHAQEWIGLTPIFSISRGSFGYAVRLAREAFLRLRPPRGGEFKISTLEAKLQDLFGENATRSKIYKELVRAREYFHIDGPFRGPRGWKSEKVSNYEYHHLHFPAVLHEGTTCPRRTMIKLKPRSLKRNPYRPRRGGLTNGGPQRFLRPSWLPWQATRRIKWEH